MRAIISQHNKLGYIDETGRVIVPIKFNQASDFDSLGVTIVTLDSVDANRKYSQMGFINKSGNFVVLLTNSYEGAFYDNFFLVEKILLSKYNLENREQKFGLADRTGKMLLESIYIQMNSVRDDQDLLIKKGNKYGLTDPYGKFVIPLKYDDLGLRAYDFYGYSSPVQLFPMPIKDGDKWYYLT